MADKLDITIDLDRVYIEDNGIELVSWTFEEIKEDNSLYDVIANAIILAVEQPTKLKELISLKIPVTNPA